ncbi:MAG: NUDIX hydrolase, partial [Parachlamydiaceae bacterium]|nr:NUDIX hydrolase [Parachlamydiaceae bacterium]
MINGLIFNNKKYSINMAILPAAIGIIFNNDNSQVLLVKRQDIPLWVMPGGGVDPGETTEEALLREVHEETGYHVKIIRKCAEYTP